MKNRILFLSPHTDDVELGCGGTIIKLLQENKNILWVVFSTAEDSVPDDMPKDTLRNEFLEVTQKLNLAESSYIIEEYKVRRLNEKRQDVLEKLVQIRNKFNPDLVIGPSLNDYHQDHQVLANEMLRAFKGSASIISYELPWNHVTFSNQMFVKLEKTHLESKMNLLKCYHSQVVKNRSYFSEEFIYGLAKMRGVQINSDYAEAFEVIRWIM